MQEAKALGLDYHNPEHVKQILCSAVNLTLLCDFASKVWRASARSALAALWSDAETTLPCPVARGCSLLWTSCR